MHSDTAYLLKEYHEHGIQLLPLPEGKKADPSQKWSNFRERPQSMDEILELFPSGSRKNVAWITGEISSNLATIDIDQPKAWPTILQNRKFAQVASRTVISRTPSRQGYHVSFRTPDPAKCGTIVMNGQKIGDIRGEGGYVLAPNSRIYGKSEPYLFESDFRQILTLERFDDIGFDWLKPYLSKNVSESFVSEKTGTTLRGLGQKARMILAGQWQELGYPSRSEAEYALIIRCIGIGYSVGQVQELFRRFGKVDLKGRERPEWISAQCESAKQWISQNESDFDRRVSTALQAYRHQNPFQGRTRNTDQAATIAILELAREAGPKILDEGIGISIRELSDRSHISFPTAQRVLKRLPIVRIARSFEGDSNRYKIKSVLEYSGTTETIKPKECIGLYHFERYSNSMSDDTLRFKALGNKADLILESLEVGTVLSINHLIESWNMERNSVKRRMLKLERVGLVESCTVPSKRKPMKAWKVLRAWTQENLDTLCRNSGTYGVSERQKQQHEKERQAYRARRKGQV